MYVIIYLLLGEHGEGGEDDRPDQPFPFGPAFAVTSLWRPRVGQDGRQVPQRGQQLGPSNHTRNGLCVNLKILKVRNFRINLDIFFWLLVDKGFDFGVPVLNQVNWSCYYFFQF